MGDNGQSMQHQVVDGTCCVRQQRRDQVPHRRR